MNQQQPKPTLEQLEAELRSVESCIESQREAEKRGTSRFSRIPGLIGEQDRLTREIALMKEPQDLALALAHKLARLRLQDVVSVAQCLRAELAGRSATQPGPSRLPVPGCVDSEGGHCD